MNTSAVNANVTIDDWANILNYTNPTQWTTPDPSNPPVADIVNTTQWLDGTYHLTTVVNASVALNFQGQSVEQQPKVASIVMLHFRSGCLRVWRFRSCLRLIRDLRRRRPTNILGACCDEWLAALHALCEQYPCIRQPLAGHHQPWGCAALRWRCQWIPAGLYFDNRRAGRSRVSISVPEPYLNVA